MNLPDNYDGYRLASPDEEEIPERYMENAEEELAYDSEKLYDVLNDTVWLRDYLTHLFDTNSHFREEALAKFPVEERALQLYHLAAPSAADYDDE